MKKFAFLHEMLFVATKGLSALPPKADIGHELRNVR
jgi:hypothetical protein